MRLAMFCYVWPEPHSSAAGVRTMALMESFLEAGFQLSVLSPCADNLAKAKLIERGVSCISVQANDSSLRTLLQELAFDIVLFDRFVLEEQFGFHIACALPNAARVIDTQDLHVLRHSRQLALNQGICLPEIFAGNISFDETALLRECASILRSDLSLLLSDFEVFLLTQRFGISPQLIELATLSLSPIHSQVPDFLERKNFVFIGNFRHPPNHDAVHWFVKKIWPKVRKQMPLAELNLYGAYPPKDISQLASAALGIHFHGPTNCSQSALRTYRVNLAPLRFGAGIKGKILDGWAAGTPAVSTPIGAEGMGANNTWGGIIASDESSFAEACIDLHQTPGLWHTLQQYGTKTLKEQFNPKHNGLRITTKLQELKDNLASHRERNVIGRILWREENRSTEYFSRWIEIKNALRDAKG